MASCTPSGGSGGSGGSGLNCLIINTKFPPRFRHCWRKLATCFRPKNCFRHVSATFPPRFGGIKVLKNSYLGEFPPLPPLPPPTKFENRRKWTVDYTDLSSKNTGEDLPVTGAHPAVDRELFRAMSIIKKVVNM